jgi:dihydrofolate reductase
MLSLITAMTPYQVIGRDNTIPWRLPADLRYFRKQTLGKPVVMGRKTYESIGKALPGRDNYILSQQAGTIPGCILLREPAQVLALPQPEIMVIGGSELYKLFLPHASRLYLTWVWAEIDGDAYFPYINFREWEELSRESHAPDDVNLYPYSFVVLQRNAVYGTPHCQDQKPAKLRAQN